jgi:protein-S-isoprenylcysteine O-methyltransferase Ste14
MLADFIARTAVWLGALALWISLHRSGDAWFPAWSGAWSLVGCAFVVAGFGLYVAGALSLARATRDARGNPNQLLTLGPYRFVRNPVYLGMCIIVVGLSLLYRSWQPSDLVRTAVLFTAAHLAVVFLEEPATRKRFGAAYDDYCRRVPRWIPRRPPPSF